MSGKSTPPPDNLPSSKTNYPKRHSVSTAAEDSRPRRNPGTEPHAQQQTHDPQQLAEQSRPGRADLSEYRERSVLPDKGPPG